MPVRHPPFAVLAAALLPLIAACGNDNQPVTTTLPGSATTAAAAPDTAPGTVTETTAATVPASYVDAEAAYTARKYAEAAELFGSYTRATPENPWGHYMQGLSAWKAGDSEQAMSSFDEALRLDPRHRKSLLNSSRVLLDTGRPR
jgi:predicted Zn-dependent protease